MKLDRNQKIVAVGSFSGVATMLLLVFTLYRFLLPNFHGLTALSERLAFTLRWDVLAVVPFFVGIMAIANRRFLSEAINPLAGNRDEVMEINIRVVNNTHEQYLVFLVATLALSTLLRPDQMKLIPAVVIAFLLARLAFWIGYRKNPLYRAPGMGATAYLNLGLLLAVLYLVFR